MSSLGKKIITAVIAVILVLAAYMFIPTGETSVDIELNGTVLTAALSNAPKYPANAVLTVFSSEAGEDDKTEITASVFMTGKAEFEVNLHEILLHSGTINVSVSVGSKTYEEQKIWCPIWFDSVACHAGGNIDNFRTTNSREAFYRAYDAGYRTFEADIQYTSDDVLALRHYWFDDSQPAIAYTFPTISEFLSARVYDRFTPMTFRNFIDFMIENPDTWLITDTKYGDYENASAVFHGIVSACKELDRADLLDRMVVQLYNENMYNAVNDVYPFKNYIFTMYQRWVDDIEDYKGICLWCTQHGVNTIVMPVDRATDEVIEITKAYGLDLCCHTVNDTDQAKRLFNNDVAIMTDDINPYMAAELR